MRLLILVLLVLCSNLTAQGQGQPQNVIISVDPALEVNMGKRGKRGWVMIVPEDQDAVKAALRGGNQSEARLRLLHECMKALRRAIKAAQESDSQIDARIAELEELKSKRPNADLSGIENE